MSSLVANPTRKAENSIYLAFSTVLVTFIVYLGEWIQGVSTGPTFRPNPVVIVVASTFIAATLMYAKRDEEWFHDNLHNIAMSKNNETEEFILLVVFFLKTYLLPAVIMNLPNKRFNEAKETILEGGTIDTEVWKLRGALWITLSIPMSAMIAASIFQWNLISILALGIAATISIVVICNSAYKLYKKTARHLVYLAEFHWFDRSLTTVRRSETTVDSDSWIIDIEAKGFTESIYRAMKGVENTEENLIPEIVFPKKSARHTQTRREEKPIQFSGVLKGSRATQRLRRRRTNELLSTECEWLRELVRRQNWASFISRFQDLRKSIVHDSYNHFNRILHRLLEYWKNSMILSEPTHAFTNFRDLCHLMKDYGLLQEADNPELIQQLLIYHEEHMADRHWAKAYYEQKLKRNKYLDHLFVEVAKWVSNEDGKDWGPPIQPLRLYEEISLIEYEHKEGTGHYGFQIYNEVDNEEIESARFQDYLRRGGTSSS